MAPADAEIEGHNAGRVVSPCACKGTAALVHLACLRRWQASLLERRLTEEAQNRALSCPVCCSALVVDGEPLVPLVPPAARPGAVRPGTLLVATERLEGEGRTFHRAVVLVCQAYPRGPAQLELGGPVRGIDLTRSLSGADVAPELHLPGSVDLEVQLRSGGPVCGGRLGVVRFVPLATFPFEDAVEVVAARGASPGVFAPLRWDGGYEAREAQLFAMQQARRAAVATAGPAPKLFLFRGHAAWGRGQLEAEIRNGSWATCAGVVEDLLAIPPAVLWDHLWSSGRAERALVPERSI